ncbi:MAG: radical SAM protein [Bacteroidales bacterium]|nr:radical SAM protein [Bacteroidales bacterium]MCF8327558.1 radical SAM protein [Bacteroidales bacterium]
MRCKYCMPDNNNIQWLKHKDILSYEEIRDITKYLVSKGIKKVRLTGGEPLVRKDIEVLVHMLAQINGLEDLSMTTNGILLASFAKKLKSAGLDRVNVSLDTLDADTFRKISSLGELNDVLEGISIAQKTGLNPVKINCVNSKYNTDQDIANVKAFGEKNGLQVRVIHQMDLAGGIFTTVEGGQGGNCTSCNRLRLSSDGRIFPCLFNNQSYDIRKTGVEKALALALNNKPKKGYNNQNQSFNQLGG